MRRVRILEDAAEEAIEAVAWYEQECTGLARNFSMPLIRPLIFLKMKSYLLQIFLEQQAQEEPKESFSDVSPTML